MIIGSPADFYPAARARLPRFLFDYADGGATSETTMAANIADLNQIRLRQRVLHDVSDISLSTNLLGQDLALPIILGPVGISGMYRRRGETQAARAAHARGLPFTLSTVSLCSLQEVRAASNGALTVTLENIISSLSLVLGGLGKKGPRRSQRPGAFAFLGR